MIADVVKLRFWSKIPKIRPARPTPTPKAAHGQVLRAARFGALSFVAGMIAMANGAAFAESYRGLFDWAHRQGMAGIWAALFPLQVDSFILVGELVLFIAALDQWRHRHRFTAWCAAVTWPGTSATSPGTRSRRGAPRLSRLWPRSPRSASAWPS
jgi:hypothetical protein